MKKLIVILSLFLAFPVYADDFKLRQPDWILNTTLIPSLPQWQMFLVTDKKIQMACYDQDGAKELLTLENDFKMAVEDARTYKKILEDEQEALYIARRALNENSASLLWLQDEYAKQESALEKEIEEKNKYKYQPSFGANLPWYILGGLVLIGGGFFLGHEIR